MGPAIVVLRNILRVRHTGVFDGDPSRVQLTPNIWASSCVTLSASLRDASGVFTAAQSAALGEPPKEVGVGPPPSGSPHPALGRVPLGVQHAEKWSVVSPTLHACADPRFVPLPAMPLGRYWLITVVELWKYARHGDLGACVGSHKSSAWGHPDRTR